MRELMELAVSTKSGEAIFLQGPEESDRKAPLPAYGKQRREYSPVFLHTHLQRSRANSLILSSCGFLCMLGAWILQETIRRRAELCKLLSFHPETIHEKQRNSDAGKECGPCEEVVERK